MSDISKCEGFNCPQVETCWRYQAPADEWQSYLVGKYENGKCDKYWKMSEPVLPTTESGQIQPDVTKATLITKNDKNVTRAIRF